MAEAIVSLVVGGLGDLLIEEAEALHGVISDRVEDIIVELRELRGLLKIAEQEWQTEQLRAMVVDARKLAYDASDVLESYIIEVTSKWKGGIKNRNVRVLNECLFPCFKLESDQIQAIKSRISDLTTRLKNYGIRSLSEGESSSSTNRKVMEFRRNYSYHLAEQEVVGLGDDVKLLVAHLVKNEDTCRVVAICGMGGLGKTTLAGKIFNHPTIKSHFDRFAMVSISQRWLKNDVLKAIRRKLSPEEEQSAIDKASDEELAKKISEIQSSRRCLVVLDDIWSNDAWDCLQPAFPLSNSSSKILVTTRNKEVAAHVDLECFIHEPKLLNEDQSWELLLKKTRIYIEHKIPKDLIKFEKLGREMIRHCDGLPLAVVVLGGILVTKGTMMEWERVHQTIESSIKRGEGMGQQHQREVLEMLELSYNDLPSQLKPCFLYLGQFSEDAEIEAEKLYLQWMAEGLLLSKDRREGETMLDVAEYYLGELANRCMVQVELEEEESANRKFKSCRLHDLMRDLSLKKAKEEDFFQELDFRYGIDQLVKSISSIDWTRWIMFVKDDDDFIKSKYVFRDKKVSRHLRSLMLSVDKYRGDFTRRLGSNLNNFKFLRILAIDGEFLNKNSMKMVEALGNLIHLRYLRCKDTSFSVFPSSLVRLEQLQTLDLKESTIDVMPSEAKHVLQNMGKLRHLYLPDYVKMSEHKLRLDGLGKLETLVNFDPQWCEVRDLHKLTSLRKLKIEAMRATMEDVEEIINYLSSTASSSLRCSTLRLYYHESGFRIPTSLLRQLFLHGSRSLHSLSIDGLLRELPVFDGHVALLSGLIDVFLIESMLEKDPMPTLEKIPNLRNLGLSYRCFEGKEIVCSATGFPQLEGLGLSHMKNLEKWRLDVGSMPNLSSLRIWGCQKLEMLPDGLRFLTALRELLVRGMPENFNNRIRVIDGVEGEDFYKIQHVASIIIEQ